MGYRIEDIDKNFAPLEIDGLKFRFANVKNEPFEIYGLYDAYNKDIPFRRLPEMESFSLGVNMLSKNTAGGKVRFTTDSPYISIRVEIEDCCHMGHMPLSGSCGFDLYRIKDSREVHLKTFIPPSGICTGERSFRLIHKLSEPDATQACSLALYLPLYNGVKRLEIGILEGFTVDRGAPFALDAPIVYYGSSITQGGCASRPGNSYQALISHATNTDHVNLGFSGSAKGDIPLADYIAGMKMSAFVMDYDYNADSPEHLSSTHEPFFKRIRNAHPHIPMIIISAPCMPCDRLLAERREIVRKTYKNALESGDRNVYFIDGSSLYDFEFCDACTVDGIHPNDIGFLRMAEAILPILKKALNL